MAATDGLFVLINDLPSYISKNMLAIILSKQGFKYSNIRIEPSKCLTTGKPVACAIVYFVDPISALAWIQVNQGELKFDGGVLSKMESSNTDRLNAVIDIRRSILEASGRRKIDSDSSGHLFDQLLNDGRYQKEDDRRRVSSSRDLSDWARHKERDNQYLRSKDRERQFRNDNYKNQSYSKDYEEFNRNNRDRYDTVEQYNHPEEYAFNRSYADHDQATSLQENYLHQSGYDEQDNFSRINTMRNWICHKCDYANNIQQNLCSNCGLSIKDSDVIEAKGNHLIGMIPTDTILIRELPYNIDEPTILAELKRYPIPIQRIRVSSSKQYCFVQLKSIEDSIDLLSILNRSIPYIGNCAVLVSFSQLSLNRIVQEESQDIPQYAIPNREIERPARLRSSDGNSVPNLGFVKTPIGVFSVYPKPIRETFQYEPESGYDYDSVTGFYYDNESGYYYDINENAWKFWSSKYSTYIPCDGVDESLRKYFDDEDGGLYNDYIDRSQQNYETRPSTSHFGSKFSATKNEVGQNNAHTNFSAMCNPIEPSPFGSQPSYKPGMGQDNLMVNAPITRDHFPTTHSPSLTISDLPSITVEFALAEAARRQKIGRLTNSCQLCNNPRHKIRECWAPIVCARCGQFKHMHKECVYPPSSIDFINSQIVNQQQIVIKGLQLRGESISQIDSVVVKPIVVPKLLQLSENEKCLNCGGTHKLEFCPLPVLCVNCGSRKHLLHQCGAVIATPEQTQHFAKMRTKVMEEAKTQLGKLKKNANKSYCLNCRSTKHLIGDCTMPFVRMDILTGKDPLSQQLKKIETSSVINKNLKLCTKCSQIGHRYTDCLNEGVEPAIVEHMKELIILYKHRGKMERKNLNPDMLSDNDELNKNLDVPVDKRSNESVNDSEIAISGAKRRRLRKQNVENFIKDLKASFNDMVKLPEINSCLNCNSKKHQIDDCLIPLLNPELNGDDLLSSQLKQFYPDRRPSLSQLHEMYSKNFCKNCVQFGHVETNCSNPKADPSKLLKLHQLILLYLHTTKVERNDITPDHTQSKKQRHESKETTPELHEANSNAEIITIDESSSPTPIEAVLPSSVQSSKYCINCLKNDHSIEDCTSAEINNEVNGSDAFSRSLRALVSDGNIKLHHLEVCRKCAGLAHNAMYCNYPTSASDRQYWGIMRLRSLYLYAMRVTNSNGPAYSGNKRKELSKLAFEQPDVVPVETKKAKITNEADNEVVEFDSCINCDSSDHSIENCNMPLLNTELNGNDQLCRQLRLLAPDGRVEKGHLAVCRKCILIGHDTKSCTSKKFGNKYEYRKLLRLHFLYKHAMKVTNSSGPAFKANSTSMIFTAQKNDTEIIHSVIGDILVRISTNQP